MMKLQMINKNTGEVVYEFEAESIEIFNNWITSKHGELFEIKMDNINYFYRIVMK